MMQILRQKVVKVIQLAVVFVLLLFVPALLFVACQVTSLESGSPTNSQMIDNSAFGVTETPAPYVPSPDAYVTSMAQNEDVWDGRIDIYGNILQGYEDILSNPTLPQATRDMFVAEMATIEAAATEWAIPAPTFDPNIDAEDFASTLEAELATLIAIDELTMTPEPTSTTEFGFLIDPDYALYSRWPSGVARGAWRGYVDGIETFIQTGGIRYNNYNMGMVGMIISNENFLYETTEPIVYALKLHNVIANQYLIMEVVDDDGLGVGTGEMYYFDMVAREFIAQPTAELLLESFLHVSVTPTPTAVLTPITP